MTNGGNFLLNIGPDATGMIPVVMQERLLDIGKWLKVNGDAIYSSQPWRSPNKPKEGNLHFTRKDGNLYIILKKWQKDPIILTGLRSAGKAELLGYKGDLKSTLQQGKLTITLPQITVDELPCEHALVIKVTNFAE